MFDFVYNWNLAVQIICFIVGLAVGTFCLVKFCDIFVDSASDIAKKLHVPSFVIGLTIVAIGTSCPELAVSVSDSIETLIHGGNANVAIGNVVGSNIANILLVLGFSAVFTPIVIDKKICKRELPFLVFVSGLLVVFGILFGISSVTGNYAILRWEALIFFALFIVYMVVTVKTAKKGKDDPPENDLENKTDDNTKERKLWKSIIFVLLGIVGIAIGGELVVFGAKGVALTISDAVHIDHDLAESLIGLTIVAVGTSLPELVTSIMAARKGENDLALGNVIGSNTVNILLILGVSGLVSPLTTGSQIIFDLTIMMAVTVFLFLISLRGKLNKQIGFVMLTMYVGYIAYLVTRTMLSRG